MTYQKAEIVRTVSTERRRTDWPEPGIDLKESDFQPLVLTGKNGLGRLPANFRRQLEDWVTGEMALWQQDEIAHRLTVRVAPAVLVSYERGRNQDRAVVIGSRVHAPHARRPSNWRVARAMDQSIHRVTTNSASQKLRSSADRLRDRWARRKNRAFSDVARHEDES